MFYHLLLTTECDLQCKYCFGEVLDDFYTDFSELDIDYSLPKQITYDLESLQSLCSKDQECVLTFYGGEPLLCLDKIRAIMTAVSPKYFMMQTNGLRLNFLEPEFVNRFHTLLVSIDGDEIMTDYYRGEGTFRKVIENLKLIAQNGFKGELIARMTVMEQTDIYRQVKWLLENNEFPFSSVHWQLNAGFWGNDQSRRTFESWSQNSYIPGIAKLVEFWIDQMETKGRVLKLYPFLGIARSLLLCEEELLRCGGGWINYAIQTDGHIIPCPTMWGVRKFYLGHINNIEPAKLEKILVGQPCMECSILNLCGGRCLYANITQRWSTEAYRAVCETVKALINSIKRGMPRINKAISCGKVNLGNFNFMKYNGCEIIP